LRPVSERHEPKPEHLARQLVRLVHARFDMRSAMALAQVLDERHHGSIDELTYGLLTGLVVTYARPFTQSKGGYGRLDSKWSEFPDQPDLQTIHDRLVELRKTLLAHTDDTPHRRVAVFTRGAMLDDRPVVTEGRSAINAPGIAEVRKLLAFQEERFNVAIEDFAMQLQDLDFWPSEAMLELDGAGNFTLLDQQTETFLENSTS
jgi:hypothetical protein